MYLTFCCYTYLGWIFLTIDKNLTSASNAPAEVRSVCDSCRSNVGFS